MRIETMIVFGDEEQKVFDRLNAYRSVLGTEPDGRGGEKSRLGRLLSQVYGYPESEPVSFEFLGTLQAALREIHERFETESDPAWWRAQGAPGPDDAVAGLAAGRARSLEDVREAERVVDEGAPPDLRRGGGRVMRPESIGARLRRLRLAAGLSQRDLAEPGCSYAYLSRIEGGTRSPSVKALRLLAAKLGVTVDYLEYGEAAPVVVVAATAEKIDEAVSLYVGEEAPTWESLTEEERRMVTGGLDEALLDTLAARIYVAKIAREPVSVNR